MIGMLFMDGEKCHLIEICTERDFGTEKSVQFWRRLSRMGKGN
jgi:hypothetical protein